LSNGQGIAHKFWMELHVRPLAPPQEASAVAAMHSEHRSGPRWTWTIVYAKDQADTQTRQERAYELVAVDQGAGRFDIDERNGIVLPSQVLASNAMGQTLHNVFAVEGTQLACTYIRGGDCTGPFIDVHIVTFPTTVAGTTGPDAPDAQPGTQPDAQTTRVQFWNPRTLQSARLTRLPE
jgi:hypothetical protein